MTFPEGTYQVSHARNSLCAFLSCAAADDLYVKGSVIYGVVREILEVVRRHCTRVPRRVALSLGHRSIDPETSIEFVRKLPKKHRLLLLVLCEEGLNGAALGQERDVWGKLFRRKKLPRFNAFLNVLGQHNSQLLRLHPP